MEAKERPSLVAARSIGTPASRKGSRSTGGAGTRAPRCHRSSSGCCWTGGGRAGGCAARRWASNRANRSAALARRASPRPVPRRDASPPAAALTVSCSRSGTRLAVYRAVHSSGTAAAAAAVASTAPFYVQRPGTGATGAAVEVDFPASAAAAAASAAPAPEWASGTRPARAPRAASLNR